MATEQLQSVKNHLEYEVLSGEIPVHASEAMVDIPMEMTSSGSIATAPAVQKPMRTR